MKRIVLCVLAIAILLGALALTSCKADVEGKTFTLQSEVLERMTSSTNQEREDGLSYFRGMSVITVEENDSLYYAIQKYNDYLNRRGLLYEETLAFSDDMVTITTKKGDTVSMKTIEYSVSGDTITLGDGTQLTYKVGKLEKTVPHKEHGFAQIYTYEK